METCLSLIQLGMNDWLQKKLRSKRLKGDDHELSFPGGSSKLPDLSSYHTIKRGARKIKI